MDGNDPEFVEAIRLVKKFFPESKGFISDVGLSWDAFAGAMMTANYAADYSCYPCSYPPGPDLGLANKGGLAGTNGEIYARLLSHAEFNPSGRAVVVPDALDFQGSSIEECRPFVCDSKMVASRLDEVFCFGWIRDTIFVFESGEMLLIDHDERVHWARSKINLRWQTLAQIKE